MVSRDLIELITSRDPDALLMRHLRAAALHRAGHVRPTPDAPLRLLLAGYLGAGNTGSEMRSSEIVRQIRAVLDQPVEIAALTLTETLSPDLFAGVTATRLAGFFPHQIADAITGADAVVACEGSTFTSTFSDTLSAMMAGALGAAALDGRPAIAYGAEVGTMSPALEHHVRENARDAVVMARNPASAARADALGLTSVAGADTAWTFDPVAPGEARALLGAMGWNGSDPVVTLCPVNPYCWPVRARPALAAEMLRDGRHADRHYGALFFHEADPEREARYRRFIAELAAAFARLVAQRGAFPLIVGMDAVDRTACADVATALGHAPATLLGGTHGVRQIVGVLRLSSLLVSARFHALVGAMPAGVPSIGVAIDDRVRHLLVDGSSAERLLSCDAPDLAQRIVAAAAELDPDAVALASRRTCATGIEGIGRMAERFRQEIVAACPERAFVDRPSGWRHHLPPLSPLLRSLLDDEPARVAA